MKPDFFSANSVKFIDFKDIEILKKFLNPNGRILSSRRTGVSAKNQRKLSLAVKRARFMALIPYITK
jgi:small subunit ribosomal protein S18